MFGLRQIVEFLAARYLLKDGWPLAKIAGLVSTSGVEGVVWSQHGIIELADDSIFHALDLVEYMETAAQYETLNLLAGEASSGIAPQNLRAIAESWKIEQKVY